MAGSNRIFERTEKKYVVSAEQKKALLEMVSPHVTGDEFGRSTICNLYFDTADGLLVRQSLDRPLYKEKLRLRSYGVPADDSGVFLEIKKKYKGVVYKRREKMTLREAKSYLRGSAPPADSQIMREIDWMLHFYGELKPVMNISYDREAFYCIGDKSMRITFDSNLLYRTEDISLDGGVYGHPILESGRYILEVKAGGAMPLWLADALDELRVYPTTFSKYGTAYQNQLGGKPCSAPFLSRYSPTLSPSAAICSAH